MMIKILYIVAFGFGTIAVHHGCATESKTVASHDNGHGGTSCGSNVCTGQTFCCNASCGICSNRCRVMDVFRNFFILIPIVLAPPLVFNHRPERCRRGIERCIMCGARRNLPRRNGKQADATAGIGADLHHIPAHLEQVSIARLILHGISRDCIRSQCGRWLRPVNVADVAGQGCGSSGV